jgi:hypothetical protein
VRIGERGRGCGTKAAHALRFSPAAGEARECIFKYAYPLPALSAATDGLTAPHSLPGTSVRQRATNLREAMNRVEVLQ